MRNSIRSAFCSAAVVTAIFAGGDKALAQDADFGKTVFLTSCAVCHGEMGGGGGPVGELFAQRPRNLTTLAKDNDGVFPLERVYNSISGKRGIQGHGDSNMPIWGPIFTAEAMPRAVHPGLSPQEIAHGRILSVVYYLQTIQD